MHPNQVDFLSSAELLSGAWAQSCALLVFPGGADLPYCRELNGRGNKIIRGAPVLENVVCANPEHMCRARVLNSCP